MHRSSKSRWPRVNERRSMSSDQDCVYHLVARHAPNMMHASSTRMASRAEQLKPGKNKCGGSKLGQVRRALPVCSILSLATTVQLMLASLIT